LQAKISNVPASIKEAEVKLAENESMHQQLCDLRPVWQDHVRLQDQEIPSLKKRLETLNEKKSKLDAEIEQVLNCISPPKR